MTPDEARYEEALANLDYIRQAKQALCDLLESLCDPSRSNLMVGAENIAIAQAVIGDAVADLFYEPFCLARDVVESYEREDWRRALCEWRTHPGTI